MKDLLLDLRYGVRAMTKQPGTAIVAVITLALGIGATTAMFSVLNAVVLRSLPYRQAERLGVLWVDFGEQGQSAPAISSLDFRDLRTMSRSFEGLAAGTGATANLTGRHEPEQVDVGYVTDNFFPLLGVEPELGRGFLPAEDVLNGPAVVLLSHELWQRRLGSDPDVVGQTIQLNGKPSLVIGVMPADFRLLLPAESIFLRHSDVWAPLQDPYRGPRNRTLLTAIGRLDPAVSWSQARADLDAIAARLRQEHEVHALSDTRIRFVSLRQELVRRVRPALWALFGAVGLMLLICCGNVAGLLLARATTRRREIAIRTALGADRWRIVRQLLIESIVLALCGGVLGLLSAAWCTTFLVSLGAAHLPRIDSVHVDGSVLGFTAALTASAVLLFGLAPALQASRFGLVAIVRGGGSRVGDRQTLRQIVVVAQVALAVVLLIGVGLLLRSFASLQGRSGIRSRRRSDVSTLAVGEPISVGAGTSRLLRAARGLAAGAAWHPIRRRHLHSAIRGCRLAGSVRL